MFAFKMFFYQGVFHSGSTRIYLFGQKSHLCDIFQDSTVIDRFGRSLAPSEGGVIAYEDHFHLLVVQVFFFQAIDDLVTRLMFIVSFNHLIIHAGGTGYVERAMIRVSSSENGNVSL